MNQNGCLNYLKSILPSLKGVDRKIGEFIDENPADCINMTVKALSSAIAVSEGSIVNFCRKLGLDGYAALKINITLALQEQSRYVLGDISLEDADSAYSVMTHVYHSIGKLLIESLSVTSPSELERAAELIVKAKHVEFYGQGTSSPIANDAYYRFMRIGINASVFTDAAVMCISASQMRPGDLAIGISHSGRTMQTIQALDEARNSGANTICITSYADSHITRDADVVLLTSPGSDKRLREATISRIAHIALLDSLCTYIAMKNSTLTTTTQDKMMRILESTRYM